MTEDRQPTMDELRAKAGRMALFSKRYAAEPGTGPAGKTCHDCAHLCYTGNVKRYPKCGKTAYTHGDATTIKTRTPACSLFESYLPPRRPAK